MDILECIILLGNDETNIIYSYIQPSTLALLSKPLYIKHHKNILVKTTDRDYNGFIRDTLRNKRDFIFKYIAQEHFNTWNTWRIYKFQNSIYNNYVSFLLQFCIDTNSQKCRQHILDIKTNKTNKTNKNNSEIEKRHKNVSTKHTLWIK